MEISKCIKDSFVVIGKEGTTKDGDGFIQKLWDIANSQFDEVEHLAKKDDKGNLLGIGVRCLIFHTHTILGMTFHKDYILQVSSAQMILKHPTAGQNGLFLDTNIFMLRIKMGILFKTLLNI